MITTTNANVYQSRFGFHPCTQEYWKKIKKVRYYQHISNIQSARYQRWERKLPKNRVRWERITVGPGLSGTKWNPIPWAEPETHPISFDKLWAEYYKCLPQPDEAAVKPLSISEEQLDQQIQLCEEWLKRIGKEKR